MHGEHNLITLLDCPLEIVYEHLFSEINDVGVSVSIANFVVRVSWRHMGEVGSNIDQPTANTGQQFCSK